MPAGTAATVSCPICAAPVPVTAEGAYPDTFPFCSPRCRERDLGRWFLGAYAVPAATDDGTAEQA